MNAKVNLIFFLVLIFSCLTLGITHPKVNVTESLKQKYRSYTKDELSNKNFRAENSTFIVDPEQIHNNIMKQFNKSRIIVSSEIANIVRSGNFSDRFVYVSDLRHFVDLSNVTLNVPIGETPMNKNKTIDKRQSCFCDTYTAWSASQGQWWWGSWNPASGCVYTGYDPNGASEAISTFWSTSMTSSTGLDFTFVADLIGASIELQLTVTNSNSETVTCNIPGYSVGQIWYQLIWGWGWISGQNYYNCGACGISPSGGSWGQGYGYAPALSYDGWWTQNIGCSTGYDRVQC